MRRRLSSVRARTTIVATTLTAVVLLLGSIAIVRVVEQDLVTAARSTLEEAYAAAQFQVGDADRERRVASVRAGDEDLFFTYLPDPDPGAPISGFLLEPGEAEPVAALTVDPTSGEVLSLRSLDGDELDELAALRSVPLDSDQGDAGVARVLSAAALEEVTESVDSLRTALILIVPGLVLILGLTIWVMVGRALRPVQAISEHVASIRASTLDERVPVPQTDDEIADLATLMNEMLDRLEQASLRQRQFVADASHELRSPLSTIKAAADVATVSEDPARFGQLAGDVAHEADRMELLIADLLDLARLDESSGPPQATVRLDEVCAGAIGRRISDLPAVELALDDVRVRGDSAQLERAVLNLVANAQVHAASRVRVQTGVEGSMGQVVVDDDGPGIAPADRERVFERFVRLDDSRTRATGGAGIGLALVRAVAERHEGTVEVLEAPELGGARFRLRIPLATER